MAMDIESIVKKKVEELGDFKYDKIPIKSLERIFKAEEIIQITEIENLNCIETIKNNKLDISFFSENKKIGVSRRSIYNDEFLLKYINFRIQNEKDYFNENKILELEEKNKLLENRYLKLIDNIIDFENLKIECKNYEKKIMQLLQENQNLKNIILEKNILISNLNSDLKSFKIVKIEK